jgi:hypothetical protein
VAGRTVGVGALGGVLAGGRPGEEPTAASTPTAWVWWKVRRRRWDAGARLCKRFQWFIVERLEGAAGRAMGMWDSRVG